jgi:Amt family ammonium transporter
LIKATMGLRVSAAEEIEGLDIGEHGMDAYIIGVSKPSELVEHSGHPVGTTIPVTR